jgi:L-lactate utilization protein LutC
MWSMQNATINWARDLTAPVKAAIENLLGRPLQDDEQVSVRAYRQHEAPRGEARREAARRLEEHLDRMARKARDVSQDEMNAAINEALEQVRPRRR